MSESVVENTELDPRIQIELEKLNSSTDEINKLEIEYDEANTTFRILLNESTRRLKALSKKLGSCVEKSRCYYELLDEYRNAQMECQKAAALYKKAHGVHAAAKETVALAEQRFLSHQNEWQFDNAWQEMLNHATMKVMEAENQKAESGRDHQIKAQIFKDIEEKVKYLEEKLQKSIIKSRPYFEEKTLCQEQLNTQKNRIESLKQGIIKAKNFYAQTLKKLEEISNEIHKKRQGQKQENDLLKGPREPGVGAELNTVFVEAPLPDITSELNKYDACSDHSLVTSSAASERDESDFIDEDLDEVNKHLRDLSIRPVEGKSEEVYVAEFQLGPLLGKK